ncbi:MAG: dihydroorotate dehydrogenase electron transfer subunit, partial [Deltaproteobacteria bacterium]
MLTEIIYNRKILPLYYKLGIRWEPRPLVKPGQFVMLHFPNYIELLLRRPFGVYRIIDEGVEILYKVVGKGTRLMTGLRQGDMVDMLGPLGNGFLLDSGKKDIIMVAGGIGIAPFYLSVVSGQRSAVRQKLLFGGRGKDDLPGLEDFKKLDIEMKISTQDGSIGEKGLVTELLKSEIRNPKSTIIYTCGPKGMLKEVAGIALNLDMRCYVSLDNVMACGIGACLGCAVKVRSQ